MTDQNQKGEHKIARFFEHHSMRYLYREKRVDLPKDAQQYVLLDYYLPDFKIYVDFLSGWEDPKQRPRLIGRIDRCQRYGIPCIFIYPKELAHLDTVLAKKLVDMQTVQKARGEEKKSGTFNNVFAISSMIVGGVLLLFSVTEVLGYICVAYGIVLFLLGNHRHLGKGSIIFFTYLWLIIKAVGKGLFWGIMHIGTVLKYIGKGIAFIAVNIAKGIRIGSIYLWKAIRWLFIWLFYILRFFVLLAWKYIRIAVKGLRILFKALFRGTGRSVRVTEGIASRAWRGVKKALVSIAAFVIGLIMIPVDAFLQGPGKIIGKKYHASKRKLQLRMQHRRFGKF